MQRDWRLIRKMLLGAEATTDDVLRPDDVGLPARDRAFAFHGALLAGAGFVKGADVMGVSMPLTDKGHDLIDTLRDEKTFEKALSEIESVTGGGAPTSWLLERIGLHLSNPPKEAKNAVR